MAWTGNWRVEYWIGDRCTQIVSQPKAYALCQTEKKRSGGIRKVSKKQAIINATLAKIKAQMVNDNDSECFTCGYVGDVDLSHLIPRSKRSDLITDKDNLVLHCRRCHGKSESDFV